MGYKKSDVTFHGTGYAGPGVPAVNVKVPYGLPKLPLDLGSFSDDGGATWKVSETDPDFTAEWIDALGDRHLNTWFEAACESGWEYLQELAVEVFGAGVKVYSEGRSGGWAIVEGLTDFDSWDAVDLGRWRKFEALARAAAADIPRQMVELIYYNVWDADPEPDPVTVVAEANTAAGIDVLTAQQLAEGAVSALRDAGLLPTPDTKE